ncbi:chaperone NapD [Caenispirillum bisanense]|uniref:chaperone NapD n=1 Tax=Caenispirillum bisanense TaxID=414052 RepID=UPI0031E24B40
MRTGRFERIDHTAAPAPADPALVNICGVLLHALPQAADAVAARLDHTVGCEVHARTADGRIVVVIEDTAEASALDRMRDFTQWDGVAASSLVFHQFEDAEALEGEIEA